jgi:hypothetical protein
MLSLFQCNVEWRNPETFTLPPNHPCLFHYASVRLTEKRLSLEFLCAQRIPIYTLDSGAWETDTDVPLEIQQRFSPMQKITSRLVPVVLSIYTLAGATVASSSEIGISGIEIGMTPAQVESAVKEIRSKWKWSELVKWKISSGEEFVRFGNWGHPDLATRSREDIKVMFSGLGSGNRMVAMERVFLFGEDLSKVPLGKTVAEALIKRLGAPGKLRESGGSYQITWQFAADRSAMEPYEYDGDCVIRSDLVGLRMDQRCGLYISAEINSDKLGRAGRLRFQMIDHKGALEAEPADAAYAQNALEEARTDAASTDVAAPKF